MIDKRSKRNVIDHINPFIPLDVILHEGEGASKCVKEVESQSKSKEGDI